MTPRVRAEFAVGPSKCLIFKYYTRGRSDSWKRFIKDLRWFENQSSHCEDHHLQVLQRSNSCQLRQTKDGPLDVKVSLQGCQNVSTEPAGNGFNCWEKPPKSGCPKRCLAVCSGNTNQRWSCLSTVRGADQRRLLGEAWCWEWFGLGAACTRLLLRFDHIKS